MSKNNPAELASQKALDEMFNAIINQQNFRLEAGAGAGKTYSLIEALKYLITEKAQFFEEKTPFSTKHGVKGAEFENVLVVCGRGWNQYNWNQMFEWMANGYPSDKQDTFERNRNLFYVSCSRAKKKLAMLFTQELSSTAFIKMSELFCKESVVGEP